MDDRLEEVRAAMEPPWDELRERRVLSRVLATPAPRKRTGWRVPMLAAAVLSTATVVWLVVPHASQHPSAPVAVPTPAPSALDSSLTLSDGSRATLDPGAHVTTVSDAEHRVVLDQHEGKVRYQVAPRADRTFEVRSGGLVVRVVGTVFTVALAADEVTVAVERGVVEVTDGPRTLRLEAGETLRKQRSTTAPPSPPSAVPTRAPAAATPPPSASVAPETPDAEALMARADAARQRGELTAAAEALTRLITEYPRDPRAFSARFTLARLETQRGHHTAAATHFQACRRMAPGGPLGEDALAEEAAAWARAGSPGPARAAAEEYLRRYPNGTHAERMRRLE